ncbi:hypothetical protein HMPREF1210_00992 [Paenisporosarcina sp. HGH0030]|uniref:hypothetical protein n=1 Tax=Paenisporosarcina sp. HGH0030 TaxID=1078085 RepID=UPI00034E6140|nr:hypothetical protein [Paenisporosarcina sp. HGH0030]EPD53261.1 hypothetical protein HMPREF1210_00992 [Paenisporosarcina sp. HGH0030]
MDPSKEFDEHFQKMQHIDRSNEARRNSLLKLQDKVGREKRYVAPIFISIAMVAVACFLIFSLVKTENPTNHLAAEIADEDKNKAAVQAILESEFTVPNEEYILIQKNINKKMDEISQSLPEGSAGFGLPADSPESLAYEELVKKTYGPYFMDYAYEHLIPTNQAFQFHFGTELEEVRYQMKVSDIQVTQSENKSAPKNYDFTAQVEYKNNVGEVSRHEIQGMAILSEEGKIGKFEIRDVGGLHEKIEEDNGY